MNKPYPFSLPPRAPGVYALIHLPTQGIYIGQSQDLRRRFTEWRAIIQAGTGYKNLELRELMKDPDPDAWEFRIVASGQFSQDELNAKETHAIERLSSAGKNVLNRTGHVGRGPHKFAASVVLKGGEPITIASAARDLGVPSKTLQKRLAKYRDKGITTVDLEMLKEMSEKHRRT